jgi:hypothetical protein
MGSIESLFSGQIASAMTRHGRTLMQAAAPASSGTVDTDFFVLAKDRTARKDPLEDLKTYTGGWDVTSKNYWAVSASSLFCRFDSTLLSFVDRIESNRIGSDRIRSDRIASDRIESSRSFKTVKTVLRSDLCPNGSSANNKSEL